MICEETKQINENKLIEKVLDIGEAMLKTGAEVTRVEDTLQRICSTYTNHKVDVFTIVSLIIINFRTNTGENITQSRRIYGYATDFDKLEELNALSRYICENVPTIEEIEKKLEKTLYKEKKFSKKNLAGSVLAASSFSVFFGGNIRDGIASGIVSILFCIYDYYFKEKSTNKLLYTFICSCIVGALAILMVMFGIGEHVDMIMIGNIMLLIPGISFMNSVKDMLCGDTMTGMLRLIESILIAVAIAVGFAAALLSIGKLLA